MSDKSILLEAQEVVNGPRQQDYGHPYENFGLIADFWSLVFSDILKPGEKVTRKHVSLAMVCTKIARELNREKRDNLTDGAGYFGTLELIYKRRDESEKT